MDHAVDSTTGDDRMATWLDVGAADEVRRRRKVVVAHDGGEILVLAHDGAVFAFENLCIHRERPLAKGVVLNGRIVCPGHQWAFDLATGWEAVKGECQPTYAVRIDDGRVLVDTASCARRAGPGA